MKVVVAGAGIGGLVFALQLHRRGIDCELYEVAETIRPLGVGINLLPHAMRELCELGLEDAIAAAAIETSALRYCNRHGQLIWHEPRGRLAGYPWPQFSVHRGELQMILHRVALERLGAARLHLGHAVDGFAQDADGVTVNARRRADGAAVSARGDVLVAADGIHSAVRRLLHPSGDPPRFGGRMLWRAVTEAAPFLDGRTMFMAGHADRKFVAYPISEPLRRQGRSRINWIAELAVEGDAPGRADWNREVDRAAFAGAFADWRWDWIDIPAIIAGAPVVYEFPLVDRDPLPRWTEGRVTLLGDAAHPMYPNGSNGSAQAILDGRHLADQLALVRDGRVRRVVNALKEYEAERLPRTAGIVLRNRLQGPEQVMQMAEDRAPAGFARIEDVIPRQELEEIALRYKRLAGFDPESLKRA